MKKHKGFSLIELLIVVAIILIIASIAIPNLMRARMSANEASAAGSLRTINAAEICYATAYPTIGFTNLANLGGSSPCTPSPTTGCFIDNLLANGASTGSGKDGYLFTVVPSGAAAYASTANAVSINQTGTRSFCSDQTGVIYYLGGSNGCTPASGTPLQ